MSLLHLVAGDKGQAIELTFVDVDTNAAADISSYSTTIQMLFTKPDNTPVTKTAAFKTDGSDGIITWTVEAAFLVAGIWDVRGRVTSATAILTTVKHGFKVIS